VVLLIITLVVIWVLCHDLENLILYSTRGVFCMRLVFTWTLEILNILGVSVSTIILSTFYPKCVSNLKLLLNVD
jgi:hypothetical protein